ncbi:4-hydroxyphenylpyruvate dioxygenase [Streptomyces fuscichromogenes]|uniref:4-hydroxyphenylpyruvate dioxygenase n=1 Tax=Streptomyces fuscichromogenes TaxID=1324013 RepID=A0A917XQC2_9ACTN|nr:4-hydroxyphenylpyruvate dioxygenase [Streptomyces fuscichromogenes]GGN45544.1 4-hydroxyphenylpyruvate dioxygenase [Streptomyces fuscichromogenes]
MSVFDSLEVDHVGMAVASLSLSGEQWLTGYGMRCYGFSEQDARGLRSTALGRADIHLVLTEADPVNAVYLERHGDGVTTIALRTHDATEAYYEAVRRGALPVREPEEWNGIVTAAVTGFGDVVHTFVQRSPGVDARALPRFTITEPSGPEAVPMAGSLDSIDHFAVCVEAGRLRPTVEYYEKVFDFRTVFAERIVVGAQAMDSIVVQSRSGGVTFTVIEPDLTREPGQIDAFVADHGGAGVQHIAFTTGDIVTAVERMHANGVDFLSTPGTYYDRLAGRLEPARHGIERLRANGILVDQDMDGQLLQIFTRSTHPRRTLFFEVIERLGARTFGSGNIKALYEAVEHQRAAAADIAPGAL